MNIVLLASSLLILLKSARCIGAGLIDSIPIEIPAGNFSYLSLDNEGLISLMLISHLGDCDIYVSQFETKPSYEHHSYCLQSSSCGVDTIVVPESFQRPLHIGIYGHPAHEISECTLNILQIDVTSDSDDKLDELYMTTKYGGIEELERPAYIKENISEYESLPTVMLLLYYVYNCMQHVTGFLVYVQFTPVEVIQLILETLVF